MSDDPMAVKLTRRDKCLYCGVSHSELENLRGNLRAALLALEQRTTERDEMREHAKMDREEFEILAKAHPEFMTDLRTVDYASDGVLTAAPASQSTQPPPQPAAEALLPCPFCQHPAARSVSDTEELGLDGCAQAWTVCCDIHEGGCGASSGFLPTIPEAIARWNRRATLRPSPVDAGGKIECATCCGRGLVPNIESTSGEILCQKCHGKGWLAPLATAGVSDGEGIYVASKVVHAPMWRLAKKDGWPIISTWIDEAEEGQTADYSELSERCLSEIKTASAVILYCEADEILKGAIIEAGAALALGKSVYCVGTSKSLSRVFEQHPKWQPCATLQDAFVLAAMTTANQSGNQTEG